MASKSKRSGVDAAFNNLSQLGKEKEDRPKKEKFDFGEFEDMFTEEDRNRLEKQAKQAEARGVEFIDVDKLIPSKLNKWSMRRDESYEAILKGIKEHGFEEAFTIVGEKRSDGNVDIISGERRTTILKELGIKRAPIVYKEFENNKERFDYINIANLHRRNSIYSIVNITKTYNEMYDNGEIPEEEKRQFERRSDYIASKLGVSPATINNHLFLQEYPEDLWILLDDKVITRQVMAAIHREYKAGKWRNHDEVIEELINSREIYDLSVPLAKRKEIAKNILDKLEKKRGKQKAKIAPSVTKEISKINSSLMKSFDTFSYPTDENEKEKAISAIDELISNLNEIRKKME